MSAVVRVVVVLVSYAILAMGVLIGTEWLRRVLALPPIFHSILLAALLAGVPIAVLVTWRYPRIGVGEEGEESAEPSSE